MKKIFLTLCLALLSATYGLAVDLPANSGKIGFLWAGDDDKIDEQRREQEKAAKDFFMEYMGENGTIITSPDQISAADFDCIWVHIDRFKIDEQPWDQIPEFFRSDEMIAALKMFVMKGGNLYLSGNAPQLVVRLERVINALGPNVTSSGNEKVFNNDDWQVNVRFGDVNNNKHPIFAGLTEANSSTINLISEKTDRSDHNTVWDGIDNFEIDGIKYDGLKFQEKTNSVILGKWGHLDDGDINNAAIVEFLPLQNGGGTIIVNGLAACQWHMYDNQTNLYADNIKLLTANTLAYLAPEDPANKPNSNFDEKMLLSTKRVALFVGYENEDGLNADNNREGKAVYNFFKSRYPESHILFRTDEDIARISTDEFDCIWVHIDRPGIVDKEDMPYVKEGPVMTALKNFHETGGNIYLSKQAVMLLKDIDESLPTPNRNDYNYAIWYYDMWFANLTQNGKDYTMHPVFHKMLQHNNFIQDFNEISVEVELASGATEREDNTSIWYMNGDRLENMDVISENFNDFCTKYNANVLATWGHGNNARDFAGIVEFKSDYRKNATNGQQANRRKAPTAGTEEYGIAKENRQGLIIANGMGGYEWAPQTGRNQSLGEIQQMTSNILAYLSPLSDVEAEAATTVTVEAINDSQLSMPFSPTGTVTIPLGVTFDQEVDPSDFSVMLKPENDAEGWKTFTGDKAAIEAQFEAVLNNPVYAYYQWKSLGGAEAALDGYYNGDEYLPGNLSQSSDGSYSYDINIDVPCSGQYTLTIAPNTGSNVTLSNPDMVSDISVEIYPNLFGTFGKEGIEYTLTFEDGATADFTSGLSPGFSVGSYSYKSVEGEIATIYVPEDLTDLDSQVAYIPGTYFADSLNIVSNSGTSETATDGDKTESNNAVKINRKADDETVPSIYWVSGFDLSGLNATSGTRVVNLDVTVSKNNATHTFKFEVQKTSSTNDLRPTEVDEIIEEDSAAPVFYNLQGIRIENPTKGLYIKVTGSKTEKVIIR